MLAVKTTCKDRWRQILNEADKIHQVHLFTPRGSFSGSISGDAGVGCQIGRAIISAQKYPEAVRAELMTLGAFIAELTGLYADIP